MSSDQARQSAYKKHRLTPSVTKRDVELPEQMIEDAANRYRTKMARAEEVMVEKDRRAVKEIEQKVDAFRAQLASLCNQSRIGLIHSRFRKKRKRQR
jgi:hypothetical protein